LDPILLQVPGIVIPYFPYGCGLYPFRSSVSLIESVT
jgi:hypothetical protein